MGIESVFLRGPQGKFFPAVALVSLLAGCSAADDGTSSSDNTTSSSSATSSSTSSGVVTTNGPTGLPDENSFTLGPETLNPEALDEFGIDVAITAQLGDSTNTYVADGTVINFMTEYGSIADSCTTTNSRCSIDWLSGQPRSYEYANVGVGAVGYSDCLNSAGVVTGFKDRNLPCPYSSNSVINSDTVAGHSGGFGQVYGNRVTIMAWIENGAETFDDANGDGLFNRGERFYDVGEPFIDHNEDGVYGATNQDGSPASGASTIGGACYDDPDKICFQYGGEHETYEDINENGVFDSEGDGIYNGPLCAVEGDGCTKSGVTIYQQMVMLQAGSWARVGVLPAGADIYDLSNYAGTLDLLNGTRTYSVFVADRLNGYMPKGTKIEFSTSYGKILSGSCVVEDNAGYGFTNCPVIIESDAVAGSGIFTVTVTSPDTKVMSYYYGISS